MMRYSPSYSLAPREWRASMSHEPGVTRLLDPEGTAMRLAAAMAQPVARDWAAESDGRYFRRRAREERGAADAAAGAEAREAHEELARRCAGLSEAVADRRPRPVEARALAARRAPARRRVRQGSLPGEAVMGRVPAGDPLSVDLIR
jgi:hypothetical protein